MRNALRRKPSIAADLPPAPVGGPHHRRLVLALNRTFTDLEANDTSISLLLAKPFLTQVRALAADLLLDPQETTLELLDPSTKISSVAAPAFKALRKAVLDLLVETVIGPPDSLVFVRRAWANSPQLHIDTAYLTIVFPIRCAPTIYTTDGFVADPVQGFKTSGLPLNSLKHVATSPAPLAITGPDEIALLKGRAWSGEGSAAVHSPPSKSQAEQFPTPIAYALIAEYREARALDCR